MTTESKGHWDGDPDLYAGELTLRAEGMAEAEELALYRRIFASADQRLRLRDAAESIEAEDLAARDPVLA